jgi:hypothetical protein
MILYLISDCLINPTPKAYNLGQKREAQTGHAFPTFGFSLETIHQSKTHVGC